MYIRPIRSERDWQTAKYIRTKVFIEEQRCSPEEEWDKHDSISRHLLLWVDDEPIGTARWRATRHDDQPVAKLERFAVLRTHRGKGYGRALVEFVIHDAKQAGFNRQYIHAQAHLEAFYASFSFNRVSDPFEEAGIRHIAMLRTS